MRQEEKSTNQADFFLDSEQRTCLPKVQGRVQDGQCSRIYPTANYAWGSSCCVLGAQQRGQSLLFEE